MFQLVVEQSAGTGEEGFSRGTPSLLTNMATCKRSRDCAYMVISRRPRAVTERLPQRKRHSVAQGNTGFLRVLPKRNGVPASPTGCQLCPVCQTGTPPQRQSRQIQRAVPQPGTIPERTPFELHTNNCHLPRMNPHYGTSLLFSAFMFFGFNCVTCKTRVYCIVQQLTVSYQLAVYRLPCCVGRPSEGKVLLFFFCNVQLCDTCNMCVYLHEVLHCYQQLA